MQKGKRHDCISTANINQGQRPVFSMRRGKANLDRGRFFCCGYYCYILVSMKTWTEATRIHTSPTALTLFPRTNIPIGIPLRLGQLLMLWPDGPVFTTLYTPGPPRRNGMSCSCITASCGQCEFRSLKKSSALDLDSWEIKKTKGRTEQNLLIPPLN